MKIALCGLGVCASMYMWCNGANKQEALVKPPVGSSIVDWMLYANERDTASTMIACGMSALVFAVYALVKAIFS